jgi:biopolymer transport protein ExbD
MQVQDDKPYDDINITPMLDLSWVLIIIFILMCTAQLQALKVNLPQASKSPSLNQPETQAITVNSEGKVFLNTSPVTLDELQARLTQQQASTPGFPVVVRGDSVAQYHSVTEVLDLLVRMNITKVALATKPAN